MVGTASMKKLATALTAIVMLAAACGSGDGDVASETAPAETESAAPAAEAAITIADFSFGDPVTVGVGTEVVTTNIDGATHTWTSVDRIWDSERLDTDGSFAVTFDEAGEFAFFCTIHPSMTGTVIVEG